MIVFIALSAVIINSKPTRLLEPYYESAENQRNVFPEKNG